MINTTHPDVHIPNSNLQKLLYDKVAIRALSVQLVSGQVEAHLDMISDAHKELQSFEEVANCIQGAKESVKDYIEDLLTDFRTTLYEEIAKVKVETKEVILKPVYPHIDANVDVTIE